MNKEIVCLGKAIQAGKIVMQNIPTSALLALLNWTKVYHVKNYNGRHSNNDCLLQDLEIGIEKLTKKVEFSFNIKNALNSEVLFLFLTSHVRIRPLKPLQQQDSFMRGHICTNEWWSAPVKGTSDRVTHIAVMSTSRQSIFVFSCDLE